jgi:hypothetical protein
MTERTEALLVGGRAGVGKSSVGYEIHEQLSAAGIRHCLIEGDNLDMAYPAPWEHHLAERNLAAMWVNYRALDYRRMIFRVHRERAAARPARDRIGAGLACRTQRPDGPQAGPGRPRLGSPGSHGRTDRRRHRL